MRKEYDFSKAKKSVCKPTKKAGYNLLLDEETIRYFKKLSESEEVEIPYQTLINLYLRDCAASNRKLLLKWKMA